MSIVTTWVTCGLVFTHKKKTPEGVLFLFQQNAVRYVLIAGVYKEYVSCSFVATAVTLT